MRHERGSRSRSAARLRSSARKAKLRRSNAGIEISPTKRGRPGRSARLRLRRLLWLIVIFLTITLGLEIVYALFASYRFALSEVRVEGTSPAGQALIKRCAPASGPNLFSLSKKQIANRVKVLPFVQSAKVYRRLPGTLVIAVEERDPIAYLHLGSQIVYLDERGVFYTSPSPKPHGLIELQGLTIPAGVVGRQVSNAKIKILRRGLDALANSPELKANGLAIDNNGWLTARLVSGVEIRLGPPSQLGKKLQLAQAALSQLKSSGPAKYLDISALEAPVWKPLKDSDKLD